MLDKVEPPTIPEGYAMSVAFHCLLDLVRGITSMIEGELGEVETECQSTTEGESSPTASAEEQDRQSASDHVDKGTGMMLYFQVLFGNTLKFTKIVKFPYILYFFFLLLTLCHITITVFSVNIDFIILFFLSCVSCKHGSHYPFILHCVFHKGLAGVHRP